MGEKMTYKQALIRSLIIGLILSTCLFLLTTDALNILSIIRDVLVTLIYGCGYWVVIGVDFIAPSYYYEGISFVVSPLIICLVLGTIIFMLYKNKQWFTPKKFIFILLGSYLLINIISGLIVVFFHTIH